MSSGSTVVSMNLEAAPGPERVAVTVHLPLDALLVVAIQRAVGRRYPNAKIRGKGDTFEILVDESDRPRRR